MDSRNILILEKYSTFRCIAGKCPSTCCAGWKIAVAGEDYRRFENINNHELREDILSNIEKRDGSYYFKNMNGGRCAMLDDDGLCRIQRNSDEETLCNTCRKFPRLTAVCGKDIWLSLAASCPVVAKYLIKDKVSFRYLDSSGSNTKKDYHDIPEVSEIMLYYDDSCSIILNISDDDRALIRYNKYIDVACKISEIILMEESCTYLSGCFDYYEKENAHAVPEILAADQKLHDIYERLSRNYIVYRSFSRYLEFQAEEFHDRYCQIMGELMLIRIIAISRYLVSGSVDLNSWIEIINWVYRLCAHGKSSSKAVHDLFINFVENNKIWPVFTL